MAGTRSSHASHSHLIDSSVSCKSMEVPRAGWLGPIGSQHRVRAWLLKDRTGAAVLTSSSSE
jgi:hypothetical protein